jgi:hypothetical protein
MLNIRTLSRLLIGNYPANSALTLCSEDQLYDGGLTMGTLYIGGQGTGKTTALARHLVKYMKKYPNRAIFVLDWSGSITDSLLSLLLADEGHSRLLKRVIYDQLGNSDWVMPLPEFSAEYGGSYEDQIQRVVDNFKKLSPELIANAPLLGGLAIAEIAPHFFRLLTAATNDAVDPSETWQITEAKRLLIDRTLLKRLLTKYGGKIPETAWYINREYLSNEMKAHERELRTYALRSVLNITDIREVKARLGYYHPGWTPAEAVASGKLVIVDGAKLIDQPAPQYYLFTQVFSLIMAEIKRRRPSDAADEPVSLVLDEVRSLLAIPGMAPELAALAPQYRSRKLQLYVVLQELSQMSKELRPHIWSLGNVVCFAISNFDEAYEISQQLFRYEPRQERVPSVTARERPILENDRGQSLILANWIQQLKKRECVMRRQVTEQERDPLVRHVPQTMTVKGGVSPTQLNDIKDELIRMRCVRVHDALEQINRRQQPEARPQTPPTVAP